MSHTLHRLAAANYLMLVMLVLRIPPAVSLFCLP